MEQIFPIQTKVSRQQREFLLSQRGILIWFTGLSGSGKSTLAAHLESRLHARGIITYLLDGDNIRLGINKDLSFEHEDRSENIRRIGEVSKLFLETGVVVLSSFISPFQIDRERVKEIVGSENYVEVFVDASLEVCEERDVKGLYKKARAGEIKNFTGVDSPYEIPTHSDIVIQTSKISIEQSINKLMSFILARVKLETKTQILQTNVS